MKNTILTNRQQTISDYFVQLSPHLKQLYSLDSSTEEQDEFLNDLHSDIFDAIQSFNNQEYHDTRETVRFILNKSPKDIFSAVPQSLQNVYSSLQGIDENLKNLASIDYEYQQLEDVVTNNYAYLTFDYNAPEENPLLTFQDSFRSGDYDEAKESLKSFKKEMAKSELFLPQANSYIENINHHIRSEIPYETLKKTNSS
ncbi:MAG: hypothetical protein ACQESC_02250 [Nanobdellota archaeon]